MSMKAARTKQAETGLTLKQQKGIAALVSCRTVDEAAHMVGVAKSTVFVWLQNEEFQAAYRKARSEVVRHAVTKAQRACSEAVRVLEDIMLDTETPAGARITAAKTILETALKAVEIENIEARLIELEKRMETKA